MKIKKNLIKNAGLLFCIILIITIVFVLFNKQDNTNGLTPVSYSGDSQILNLTAKGGFSPAVLTAKAGVNTILNVITNNTFDCSSSIRIPALNISQNLALTGTTPIELGSHSSGEVIDGTCLMGMYSFKIKFI